MVEEGIVKTLLPSHEQTIADPIARLDSMEVSQNRRFTKIHKYTKPLIEQGIDPMPHAFQISQKVYPTPPEYFTFFVFLDIGIRMEYEFL